MSTQTAHFTLGNVFPMRAKMALPLLRPVFREDLRDAFGAQGGRGLPVGLLLVADPHRAVLVDGEPGDRPAGLQERDPVHRRDVHPGDDGFDGHAVPVVDQLGDDRPVGRARIGDVQIAAQGEADRDLVGFEARNGRRRRAPGKGRQEDDKQDRDRPDGLHAKPS